MREPPLRKNLDRGVNRAAGTWGVLLLVSCQATDRQATPAYLDPLPDLATPIRQVTELVWDTVFTIGGDEGDTLLLVPGTLGGGRDRIAAFDYGDNRIKRFDLSGRLAWAAGGTGSGPGPGEFEGNFGLQVDQRGFVWAADPNVSRLTALDDTGGIAASFPLPVEAVAGLAIVDGHPVAISSSATAFLLLLGPDGTILQREAPPALLRTLPTFARSVIVASSGGNVWAVAFPYGNLFFVYSGTTLRCAGTLVTGSTFPMTGLRDPAFSVAAIALRDTVVVMLANGGGEGRLRHLDSYSLGKCAYRESWALPRRDSAMAIAGSLFAFESHGPVPRIVGLRMRKP